MNRLATTLLLLAALGVAIPAGLAQNCRPSTSDAIPMGELYLVNDVCDEDCLVSFYVYEETNGADGLQRGDDIVDDTCAGMIKSDTIVL